MWSICAFRVLNPHQQSLAKKYFQKLIRDVPNVPKQAEAERDGVINPQYYNFKQILTRKILMLSNGKILMLSNATNQPKSTVELG